MVNALYVLDQLRVGACAYDLPAGGARGGEQSTVCDPPNEHRVVGCCHKIRPVILDSRIESARCISALEFSGNSGIIGNIATALRDWRAHDGATLIPPSSQLHFRIRL
jgi:hypothetical protein